MYKHKNIVSWEIQLERIFYGYTLYPKNNLLQSN